MKVVRQKMREECQKSIKMRSLSIDEKYSSFELREEQDKVYKKYLFLKGLNKALEEKEKNGGNNEKQKDSNR